MMQRQDYPNLTNAPIDEAIITLTVRPTGKDYQQAFGEICNALQKYYHHQRRAVHEFGSEDTSTSQSEENDIFELISADQKNILRISGGELSLHRLKPYVSWEEFEKSFKTAWNAYATSLQIEKIKTVEIRYINNFNIPTENWTDYLLMWPAFQVESESDYSASMHMVETFSRYTLASERYVANAFVDLILKPENREYLQVIISINIHSKAGTADPRMYPAIAATLSRLRDFKNEIFFANVPKAEELFS